MNLKNRITSILIATALSIFSGWIIAPDHQKAGVFQTLRDTVSYLTEYNKAQYDFHQKY